MTNLGEVRSGRAQAYNPLFALQSILLCRPAPPPAEPLLGNGDGWTVGDVCHCAGWLADSEHVPAELLLAQLATSGPGPQHGVLPPSYFSTVEGAAQLRVLRPAHKDLARVPAHEFQHPIPMRGHRLEHRGDRVSAGPGQEDLRLRDLIDMRSATVRWKEKIMIMNPPRHRTHLSGTATQPGLCPGPANVGTECDRGPRPRKTAVTVHVGRLVVGRGHCSCASMCLQTAPPQPEGLCAGQ
jgi:hypothetical protein